MTSTYEKNLSQMQQKMLLEQRRIKLRRLGRNRVAVIGTLIVLVMAVIAIAAPRSPPTTPTRSWLPTA